MTIWAKSTVRLSKEQFDRIVSQVQFGICGNPISLDVECVNDYIEFEIQFPMSSTFTDVGCGDGKQ